jgi:hypothetical protein
MRELLENPSTKVDNTTLIEGINKKIEEKVFDEVDEILYELNELTDSDKASDHYAAADLIKNLTKEQEAKLVKKIDSELLEKLQKIEVPDFGRRQQKSQELDHIKNLEEKLENEESRNFANDDKDNYLISENRNPDIRRRYSPGVAKPEKESNDDKEIISAPVEEPIEELIIPETQEAEVEKAEAPKENEDLHQKIEIELCDENDFEIEKAFQENFGINAEDLENIDGFESLSSGQKKFVLEKLRQVTLGKVKDGGEIAYEEKTQKIAQEKKGLDRRVALAMHGLLKIFNIPKNEKKLAAELMAGGMTEHGELLCALVKGMKDGPEVIEKNNELEIQFASLEKWHDEDERRIAENLNSAATEFMQLPKEWGYEGKNPEEVGKLKKILNTHLWGACGEQENREKYEDIKKRYEAARAEYLELEAIWHGEKWACQDVNSIDAKIQLNQLLNQNPEAEKELLAISTQSKFSKGLINSLKGTKGKGISMGVGFAARSLAIGTAGTIGSLIAAPVIGGALGAWRGHKQAEKNLEAQDKKARRGEGMVDEKAKNFVPAAHLIKRLSDLSLECEQLKDSNQPEKFGQSVMSLKTRIDYTQEKIDDGLVDFGTTEDYSETSRQEQNEKYSASEKREGVVGRQFQLIQELSQAKALAEEINLQASDRTLEDRLGRVLEQHSENITKNRKKYVSKETLKTARNCAGFAIAGWVIRDLAGEWFHWKNDGSFLKKSFGKVRELVDGQNNIEVAPISLPLEMPDDFVDKTVSAETAIEMKKYLGGNSVWKEAENQVSAWREVDGHMPVEDIDKVKNLIVDNPSKYGLPEDIDFNNMSAKQIEEINWQNALNDAMLDKELPTDFDVSIPEAESIEPELQKAEYYQPRGYDEEGNIVNLDINGKPIHYYRAEEQAYEIPKDKGLNDVLENSSKIRTDEIGDLPLTEEVTVPIASAEHLDTFMNDSEAQKNLAEISSKAKEYFNSQNSAIDRQTAWDKVMSLKKPIEEEFGGQLGIDRKGNVELKLPNGSSKILFKAKEQIVSDVKIENTEPGNINIKASAFIKNTGQENLNTEALKSLKPDESRALTETSRQLSVLVDNLKRLPPNSPQAVPIRKTMAAIINSGEHKFGKEVFNNNIKELAGLKISKWTAYSKKNI